MTIQIRDGESQAAFTIRIIQADTLTKVGLQIEDLISAHRKPYTEAQEHYVSGLLAALEVINKAY